MASGQVLSMGINAFDAGMGLGIPSARRKALNLNKYTRNNIVDLVDPNGVVEFFYTGVGNTKVPSFTGVLEGDAVTYIHSEKENAWILTDLVLRSTPIIASGLTKQNTELKKELQQLKRELSEARLENELCRHEVARAREKQEKEEKGSKPKLGLIPRILIGLLVGMLLASHIPGAHAQELKEETPDMLEYYREVLRSGFNDAVVFLKQELTMVNMWEWYSFIVFSWPIQVITFCVIGYLRFTNVIPTLLVALLGTWSGWNANALIPLSVCERGTFFSYLMLLFFIPIHLGFATLVYLILISVYTIVSMVGGDQQVDKVLAGVFATTGVFIVNVFTNAVGLPKEILPVAYILYRVTSFAIRRPENVVVRDASGKVVETSTVPPKESAYVKFSQKLRSMFQRKSPRVEVSHFFQVPSHGTVLVKTELGTGTGFRVQNWIVTAKHVLSENDVVEVVHEGTVHASKVKWRHPEKDVAYLVLPPGLQSLKAFKIGDFSDGPVAIVSRSGDFVNFATAEGIRVGDEITYAVTTGDGTSGAPIILQSGKAVGVHVINTGFSAGGVLLTMEDLPPTVSKTDARVKELEEEVQRLRALQQCDDANGIVELVREAVRREMIILRKELQDSETESEDDGDFLQKRKGKTKRGKTWKRNATHNRQHGEAASKGRGPRNRKKRVWTEQEYQELLDEGYTVEELKKMADDIRAKKLAQWEDADYHLSDDGPYSDPEELNTEDEEEINREWFGQAYTKGGLKDKFKQQWSDLFTAPTARTAPVHVVEMFTPDCDESGLSALDTRLKRILKEMRALLEYAIPDGKWRPGVVPAIVLEELTEKWYEVNELAFFLGMPTFLQLKKEKRVKEAEEQKAKNAKPAQDVLGNGKAAQFLKKSTK
uniref:ORF1a protein n=1 Tax=Coleura bat astrovirus TaxID=3141863 RepID=A0AAU7E1N0_9VIRU